MKIAYVLCPKEMGCLLQFEHSAMSHLILLPSQKKLVCPCLVAWCGLFIQMTD